MLCHLAVFLDQGLACAFLVAVLGQQALALGVGLILKGMGVQAQDHAVRGTLLVWLLGGDHADIIQEFMPETAVQQVQGGVLHTAVVPVHRAPILQSLFAGDGVVVLRVAIAQEVPAGTGPLGHGVGLALGGGTAAGAGRADPLGVAGQRAFAVLARLKVLDLGQAQGQLALGQGHPAALVAVDHGDRLAPVALAAEHPVAQLEVDLLVALAVLLEPGVHLVLGILNRQAVQEVGVDERAGGHVGEGLLVEVAGHSALDDLDDGQAELLGKLPVAGVVGRHGHDGAGAIGCQDVVGDKDGDLLAVDRVDALDALDDDTGLFLVQLGALEVGLAGGFLLVGSNSVGVLDETRIDPLFDESVLGADDHVGRTEQRIRAGGVDGQGIACSGVEVDLGTVAAADPVALLSLDAVDVIHIVQVVDEAVSVGGDFQHPLALVLLHNGAAAALTDAVDNFLVGQNDLAAGAVVDGRFLLISQTLFEQLNEDPLRPLIILGVGGVDFTVPVEGQAQGFQLALEAGHVLGGDDLGVDMVFQGVVFSGQTESVPAHGVQDVIAALALFARDDIQRGVAARMADVQTGGRRIRELDQRIELRLGMVDFSVEGILVLPHLLPFGLDGFKIVFHNSSPHR